MKHLARYMDWGFCLAVLPAMILMFPMERWYHNFQWYVISLTLWLYLLYILNRTLTVPLLLAGGPKRAAGAVLTVLSIGITLLFSCISLYPLRLTKFDEGFVHIFPLWKGYQQAVWSLFMIVEAFSFAVGLFTANERQRARRRALEAERDHAEIALYRAQIKPHFMFNTLNSLYGLFLTGSEKALPSLERYISMMRYMHTTATRDLVPLREEEEYIRELVALQSLRLNDRTRVEMQTDVADGDALVPPMLLVTFVENCFKHGVSPQEDSTIRISLKEKEGVMTLRTENRIFRVRREGEHMGIENCRKRLELSYPGRHSLRTGPEGELYKVELSVTLRRGR